MMWFPLFGYLAGFFIAGVVAVLVRMVEGRWPHYQWWIFIPLSVAILCFGISKGIQGLAR